MALTSTYVPALENKGSALMLSGRFEEADEFYALAVEGSVEDPLLPYRSYLRAVSAYCASNPALALQVVEQALVSSPNLRALELLRAACLKALGEEAACTAALKRADNLPRKVSIITPKPPLPSSWDDFAKSLNPVVG